MWADEASRIFGGLDICTVDVLHSQKDGKEYILEVNGTSSGFMPDCLEEDNAHVREVTLQRWAEHIAGQQGGQA
jgi:glutathione synthase/RimK-type ligase-like ATP-grasp enzyme